MTADKGPVSIKDIARAAKVSHSTVSRALRNSPLVNAETAERIRRIARESDFHISAAARSLVTGRTNMLGVVVATISDPFVGEVVEGIEAAAQSQGYSVVLATSRADASREMQVVQAFEEQRVAGILINASFVGARYLNRLSKMRVPIVLINNHHPGEFIYSVSIDNLTAVEASTRYLIQLGHRRIAYLGFRGGAQSDGERSAGFRKALDAAGLPALPEWIAHADSTPEGALRVMEHMLAQAELPTAVVCYNDMSALGALKAARQRGLRVPDDFSIMGFDDLAIASYTDPPLTTVRQPKREIGRLATEILLSRIGGSDSETNCRIPGELIVRGSTAPPRPATARIGGS